MADQKNDLAVPRQEQHNPSVTSTIDAESANPLKGADDVERAGPNTAASWWRYLNEDIDTAQTTGQLALYCFMTGYMYVFTPTFYPIPLHTASKAMSSPSPQFSSGAASKRVTLPRYLIITCSAYRKTHAFSLPACYRPSSSLLRTFGVPRHYVPLGRSTSTNLANLLQCRRVHRPHWRPCGCPQAYMARRRHLHPGGAHHGCCYCFLEERPTEYIER